MKLPAPTREHFQELLLAAVENRLTVTEFEEWNTLLQEDPEARLSYLQQANLHSTLHQRFATALDSPQHLSDLQPALASLFEKIAEEDRAAAAASSRRFRLMPFIAWKIAATLVFAALLFLSISRNKTASTPTPLGLSDSSATITGLINVAWEDPALDLHLRQHLPANRLHLRAGLVRVELPTGATIVLQGPAQFQLESPASLKLLRGNLTAHVPPAAVGFTVSTPNSTVTDLGTEFGVYVNRDDETHTEVFVGKVRVNATTDTGVSASQILEAGHAVRISDASVGLQTTDMEPLVFVRPAEFDAIQAGAADPAYARWLACSNQIRRDHALLAYYNFEPASSTVLPNLSLATAGQSDGAIDHATWDAGRFAAKHALRFDGTSSVQMNIPGPSPSLTMATWMNAEDIAALRQERQDTRSPSFVGIFLSDGAREAALHWQLMDGVRSELGVGLSADSNVLFVRFRSLDVITPQEQGKWIFLATVIDDQSHKVRHYLDGALIGTNSLSARAPVPVIGNAEIGNWNPLSRTDHPKRGFRGRIDEFVIFNRALSDQEIQAIYAAGSGG